MKTVQLVLFMGQSNMAGRGNAKEAPIVSRNAGYEYRAVSDIECLHQIIEPFGLKENDETGVYEPDMKTGSMVSAFVNAYYDVVKVPVVGVSCSKGGSSIAEWMPGSAYYQDAVRRTKRCSEWLESNGYQIEHRCMVWCQGCTDGDLGTPPETYKRYTSQFIEKFLEECQLEVCFLIQIGNRKSDQNLYRPIQQAQQELAEEYENIIMVSRQFEKFAQIGLMKDEFHYYQKGYNLVGEEAGRNAGSYMLNITLQN